MTWRIDVDARVRPLLRALDPSLRLELIERVDAMADDPLPQLRHALPPDEPPSAWVLEYVSDVIGDLLVRAYFREIDPILRQAVLFDLKTIAITRGEPD